MTFFFLWNLEIKNHSANEQENSQHLPGNQVREEAYAHLTRFSKLLSVGDQPVLHLWV